MTKQTKQITVILLDKEASDTDHYLELVREELIKRLKPLKLWVAGVEVQVVIDQETEKGSPIVVKDKNR